MGTCAVLIPRDVHAVASCITVVARDCWFADLRIARRGALAAFLAVLGPGLLGAAIGKAASVSSANDGAPLCGTS